MIVVHTFSVCNVSFSTLCFPLPLIPFFSHSMVRFCGRCLICQLMSVPIIKNIARGQRLGQERTALRQGRPFLIWFFFSSFSSPIVKNVHLLDVRSRFKAPPPSPHTIFCVNDLCCVSSLKTPWPYLPLLLPVRSLLTPIHLSACGLLYQHRPCPLRNPWNMAPVPFNQRCMLTAC